MQKNLDQHIFTGMQIDYDVTKLRPELLVDARNIRFTTRGDNTLLALTNEKGTVDVIDDDNTPFEVLGTYLGHGSVGEYIVVFTYVSSDDHIIYRLLLDPSKENKILESKILYRGNLNFSLDNPIETYNLYENENIQKIYWVDGRNQARVINVVKEELDGVEPNYDNNSFDFIQDLQLNESVTINVENTSNGMFPAGVVQYAFNYYNKYGQESNIVWVSPLYYTTFIDRGGSPEETLSVAFKINIDNVDSRFDYLRLYSIFRTSLDVTPQVKTVKDFKLDNVSSISYIDNNTEGYNIDPTSLLYIGGEDIIPGTISSKDNTLFLGNYKINRPDISQIPGLVSQVQGTSGKVTQNNRKINNVAYSGSTNTSTQTTVAKEIRVFRDSEKLSYRMLRGCAYFECKDGYVISGIRVHKKFEDYDSHCYIKYSKLICVDDSGAVVDAKIEFKNATKFYIRKRKTGETQQPDSSKVIIGYRWLGDENTKNGKSKYDQFKEVVYGNASMDWAYQNQDYIDAINKETNNGKNTDGGAYLIIADLYVNGVKLQSAGTRTEPATKVKKSLPGYDTSGIPRNYIPYNISRSGDEYGYIHIASSYYTTTMQVTESISDAVYTQVDAPKLNVVEADNPTSIYSSKTFKGGEWYRLGLQFQYKNGKWSEPCFITDFKFGYGNNYNTLNTASLQATCSKLIDSGYLKVRPIIVQPDFKYWTIVAQGFLNPTVYNVLNRQNGFPQSQSSWFTRVIPSLSNLEKQGKYTGYYPQYKNEEYLYDNNSFRGEFSNDISTEERNKAIENQSSESLTLNYKDRFKVDYAIQTFHSPDIVHNEDLWLIDFNNYNIDITGKVNINRGYGDILLQTSTPALDNLVNGFIHYTTKDAGGGKSLMSGAFYNDSYIDFSAEKEESSQYFVSKKARDLYFMIYPWQSSGSLNNDRVRTDGSTRSSVLKHKVISNTKVSNSIIYNTPTKLTLKDSNSIKLFNSDQLSHLMVGGYSYFGNIDTVITSDYRYTPKILGEWTGDSLNKRFSSSPYSTKADYIDYWWNVHEYITDQGLVQEDLLYSKSPVRVKYKSTPHIVLALGGDVSTPTEGSEDYLVLADLYKNHNDPYTSHDIKEMIWIPAGESSRIGSDGSFSVSWKYGDTYFQRYECLKTYPFTQEDENSIVDIVSFMCETRVNLGGRYDKNRGQLSNLYMTPQNFNLLNPVYNQMDNYFNYKILDEDFYKIDKFNTDITWSLQKTNAEDIDKYTKTTLASTYSIDGNKGPITALANWNQHLYAFQDKGISEVLFNSRVQIPVSEGQPIEISNNYKLDGNQYISSILGCDNKWTISNTPSGLYFMESRTNELHHLSSEGLKNISATNFMSSWFKNNTVKRTWYDLVYNDLYVQTDNDTLVFSEQMGGFTSFMDYSKASCMFNSNDGFYALTNNSGHEKLWQMYAGNNYCNIFGQPRNYGISFISNKDSAMNKIFNNIDIRGDWFTINNGREFVTEDFFDTIRLTNEYQDTGVVSLDSRRSNNNPLPNLAKKFRIWNIQLPRDMKNEIKGRLRDRISNTWTKIELNKNASSKDTNRMEIHDLNVTSYI